MRKCQRALLYLLSLPKTILFNFLSLPFREAIKLPFFVAYNVKIGELHKGIFRIEAPIKHFMIKFGFGGVKGIDSFRSQLWIQKGTIRFMGCASFAEGCSIRNNGDLVFGKNFGAGKNCFISCSKNVVFGDDIMMAWNSRVRDSDGHTVLHNGVTQESSKSVHIENHVWIAANVTILKGVTIRCDSVVAYGSIVTKPFEESGILIGGVPAKKLRNEITWKE